MFKINGKPESLHEGSHLGGVLNKMYDEPISLAKHANVASDSVNARSQCHKQLSSEVICQFIRTACSALGQGKEVGFVEERFNGLGIRVLNPAPANPTSFTFQAQNKQFE